jgi:hypothetical protein
MNCHGPAEGLDCPEIATLTYSGPGKGNSDRIGFTCPVGSRRDCVRVNDVIVVEIIAVGVNEQIIEGKDV